MDKTYLASAVTALVIGIIPPSQAASLVQGDGGLYARSDAEAQWPPSRSDGPYAGSDWGKSGAASSQSATDGTEGVFAENDSNSGFTPGGPQLTLDMWSSSQAFYYLGPPGSASASGGTNTLEPTVIDGSWWQIVPDQGSGEQIGDPVSVDWSLNATLESVPGGKALLNGGGWFNESDPIRITLNDDAPANWAWSHDPLIVTNDYVDSFYNGTFTAQIGDIIGLHMGAFSSADATVLSPEVFADSSATLELTVSSVPLPPAILLFGSALGGLLLVRRRPEA